MSRIARVVIPGLPYHVTQRGNRREDVFFCEADWQKYLDLVLEYSKPVSVPGFPGFFHVMEKPFSYAEKMVSVSENSVWVAPTVVSARKNIAWIVQTMVSIAGKIVAGTSTTVSAVENMISNLENIFAQPKNIFWVTQNMF